MSTKLSCGCKMDEIVSNDENVFIYEPCSPVCEYWLFVKDEINRRGMPALPMIDPTMTEEMVSAYTQGIETLSGLPPSE